MKKIVVFIIIFVSILRAKDYEIDKLSSATVSFKSIVNDSKANNHIPSGTLDYLISREASLFLSNPVNFNYFENYSFLNTENNRLVIAHNWVANPKIDIKDSKMRINKPYDLTWTFTIGIELDYNKNGISTIFSGDNFTDNVGFRLGYQRRLFSFVRYSRDSQKKAKIKGYEESLITYYQKRIKKQYAQKLDSAKHSNFDTGKAIIAYNKDLLEKNIKDYYETFGEAFDKKGNYSFLHQYYIAANLFAPISDADFIRVESSDLAFDNLDTVSFRRVEGSLSLNGLISWSSKNRLIVNFEMVGLVTNNVLFGDNRLTLKERKVEEKVINSEGNEVINESKREAYIGNVDDKFVWGPTLQFIYLPSGLNFDNGATIGIRFKREWLKADKDYNRVVIGIPFTLYSRKKEQINFEFQYHTNYMEDLGKLQPFVDSRVGIALAIPFGGFKK